MKNELAQAMRHLDFLNTAISDATDFSNLNMMDTVQRLQQSRRELIEGNATYRDAAAKLMAGDEPPAVTLDNTPYIDYSDMETRILAWLADAGEEIDKLDTPPDDIFLHRFRSALSNWVTEVGDNEYKVSKSGRELYHYGIKFLNNSTGMIDICRAREVIVDGVTIKSNYGPRNKSSIRGDLWAQEFLRLHPSVSGLTEDVMSGWFANAIEAGRSAQQAGYDIRQRELTQTIDNLDNQIASLRRSLSLVTEQRNTARADRNRMIDEARRVPPKLIELEEALKHWLSESTVARKRAVRSAALDYFQSKG